MSETIRVRSILGRFLEHHRVWYFANDGDADVWLASADWMGRNLFRRVEVAFPVRDPALRKRVVDEGLRAYLADNVDAWELHADGKWAKVKRRRGSKARSAQSALLAKMRAPEGA
jgi:polyphosphate kinase